MFVMNVVWGFILRGCIVGVDQGYYVATVIEPVNVGRASFNGNKITIFEFGVVLAGYGVVVIRYGAMAFGGFDGAAFIGIGGSIGHFGDYQGVMFYFGYL